MDTADEKWMKHALGLAEKGRLTTSPNPMVGACIVRAGRLVGEGFHHHFGGNHAEIRALQNAGRRAAGGTLYVTLEPCASWGKTPPCAARIIRSGIRRVVVGSLDPNPRNHRKGVHALRNEGIQVRANVLSEHVQSQNEAFFKLVRKKMPFITLKMAQSLDGKIATSAGASRWVSSNASRQFVHHLRAEQDAILIGKNTLLLDNPKLSPHRTRKPGAKPWRIVLDPELEVPEKARIFGGTQLTLIAVSKERIKKITRSRRRQAFILIPVSECNGQLDVEELMRKLGELGVAKLLVEGGGELAWSLLSKGLVDKAYWVIAPKIIGGRSAKTSVEGAGIQRLSRAMRAKVTRVSSLGDDWLFETRFPQS